MSPMPSSKSWFSRMLALSLAVLPAAAHAQSLPKGYASDELPSTPAPATTATTTAPATPAPEMKSTVTAAATTSATTQISTTTDDYADTDASALTDFREPLQGYGTWVADDTYGTVWVPDTTTVGADFAPYQTGGYWTLTDDGDWLWVSTYDWGYVPFHYGRWIWISGRGWAWIPGRVYAPAWVTWRVSDYGYIGWAPLPPLWYWSGTSVVYFSSAPVAAYVFCPTSYVFHTSVHTYVVKDKDTVKRVAAHSRSYKAASPTAAKADHKAADSASASKGGASALQRPKGPSMKDAGVPDSAVPKKRGAHDSRAEMFSKKSTTASAKALVKKQRAASISAAGNAPATRAATSFPASSGVSRAGSSVGSSPGVVRRSGPAATASSPTFSQPAARGSSTPVLRTPTARGGASAQRPAAAPAAPASRPGAATAGTHHSPAVSAPRAPAASAPRASAPAARKSTPSASPSRPGASPARPSVHRGGRR